jgi:hypothetical protein
LDHTYIEDMHFLDIVLILVPYVGVEIHALGGTNWNEFEYIFIHFEALRFFPALDIELVGAVFL